jgi:hypothetical protein
MLVNVPAPEPIVTLNVDEPVVVPYTRPLTLTCVAPSSVILPPKIALEDVILEAGVVASKVGLLDGAKVIVRTALTVPPVADLGKSSTVVLPLKKFCSITFEALNSVDAQK